MPVKLTNSGLVDVLSVMTTEPARTPTTAGVKVTFTGQLAAGLRLLGQSLVKAKSPLAATLEMVTGTLPELVTVTV